MKKSLVTILLITIKAYTWAGNMIPCEEVDTVKIGDGGEISIYGVFPEYGFFDSETHRYGVLLFKVSVDFSVGNDSVVAFDKAKLLNIECLAIKKRDGGRYARIYEEYTYREIMAIESAYKFYFERVTYISIGEVHRAPGRAYHYTYYFTMPTPEPLRPLSNDGP